MKLTIADFKNIKDVELAGFSGNGKNIISGISTDSRTLRKGELFVALRGEKYNGHDFISTAITNGACAIMVERSWVEQNQPMFVSIPVPRIVVPNTLRAFGELARLYRQKFEIPVLMIAGSNGKTTTKDMITAVLHTQYNVLATEQNFNNHIGVPKTLFELKTEHDIVVLEAGTNHFGELRELCEIAEPTHGLLTNIGHEHLEFFGSLKGVAKAEGELVEYLYQHRGKIFVNADDPWICKMVRGYGDVVKYGFRGRQLHVQGKKLTILRNACTTFTVHQQRRKDFIVELNIAGEHNAWNALSAVAVGLKFGIRKENIQQALRMFRPTSKRMEILHVHGITILNDTYNANVDSMIAALKTLSAMETEGRRIAVLADMLELGEVAEEQHKAVGTALRNLKIDAVFTYGQLSASIHLTANTTLKKHFTTKAKLIESLLKILNAGDALLVKGSRGMKMEEVIQQIQQHFSHIVDA